MQLIDNKSVKAGDYLSEHISTRTDLSVVSSLFSIYAIEMLEGKLPFIQNLRLLLSSTIDIHDNLSLIGDQDERKLRNRLTQQYVAEKCKEWLSVHSEIKQAFTRFVNTNLFCAEKVALQGSADFTAAGLGFVASMRHDICTGVNDRESIKQVSDWFESIWSDFRNIQDIKKYLPIRQV